MQQTDRDFLKAYKFCPKCGSKMVPREQGEELMPTCQNEACGFIFWQNSKPCVVTVIQDDKGRVLMTERGIEPDKGKLDLPGGFMKLGEHPRNAAIREAREEIGVEVELISLLGFEIDHYFYQSLWETTLTVGWLARISKGKPYRADPREIKSIKWLDVTDYKPETLAFTSNERYLKRVFVQSRE